MNYPHFITGILAILATLSIPLRAQSPTGFAFQQYAVVKEYSGAGNVRPYRVQADRYNNTYVLGYYKQSVVFSPAVSLTTPSQAIYLAKFDPSGNALWARNVAGTRSYLRRGSEIATLFVDAEGHSYVSMLIDSARAIAGVSIAVPAGQRVVTIAKYDAQGTVYFSKYVANGAGLSMPDYKPMCADLTGNIYFALNVRAGTQVRYGPRIAAFTGVQPMLVRLANVGNYAASIVPEVKAQNRTYQGLFTAISCNERKVYIGGMVLDTLVLRDEAGIRRTYPNTPGVAGEEWRFMYCMELDKATGTLGRYTERNNVNRVYSQYSGTTWIYDVTARPDSGCYFIYPSYGESQGQSGSTVSDNYNLISGAFGANLLTGIRDQEYNYFDGFSDRKDEYYRFDRLHYSASDNTLLVLARTGDAFTPNSLDYVDSRPTLVTSVNLGTGLQNGTVSVVNRMDAFPLPLAGSFAAVGTVGGNGGIADDTARFKSIVLVNASRLSRGYLARYSQRAAQSGTIITRFSPTSGKPGDHVIIRGKGFGRVFNVYFNGMAASFVRGNDSTLNAVVPAGATTGRISVVAASGSPVSDSAFVVPEDSTNMRMEVEETLARRMTLAPNPTSGVALVSGLNALQPLRVTDLAGKTVLVQVASQEGTAKVDVSTLQPGLYLVRQGSQVVRLVKE